MTEETARLIEALDKLIDRERTAILEGDFDGLAALLQGKSRMMDHLNKVAGEEARPLADLSRKIARNQELLGSAMQGLRSVQSRLAALQDVRDGLRTYDAKGRQHRHVEGGGNTVERRA